MSKTSDFLFTLQPTPPPPIPTNPPAVSPRELDFGSISAPFRLRLAPFGSVLGLFWVRFGSVSRCWVGSGWGRGEGLL